MSKEKIGLLAGKGQFPILIAKKAKEKGYEVYVIGLKNETDAVLEEISDEMVWLKIGDIKKQIKFFKKHNVSSAVMAGSLSKSRALADIKPDLKAIMLLAKSKFTGDDNLLRGYADVFKKDGIEIKESTFFLPEILAGEGVWTKRHPSKAQTIDMQIGFNMAKEIGRLDIGQCLIINNGSVLAVEGIDGTDATIKRSGNFSNGESVVVKICKPNQDLRFDIPSVGLETLKSMKESKATLLVIEADKTIVFDKEAVINFANENNISIVATKGFKEVL